MSKERWRKIRLDELKANKAYALNGGPFGSNLVRADYRPEGIPVIRGGNITGDAAFSYDDLAFVSEEKADELRPNNAHPGDLIFTQRGTLGQVGMIPKDTPYPRFVVSQSQMKLTVNEELADPHFLYCYFRAPSTIQTIHNLAFSSGVPHINLDILRNFELLLPPLSTQRKIAAILSAYDDLMEVNTRRIAILEEMARSLYREWFVRFRFPGHESARMVKSAVGVAPAGWAVKALGDIADVNAAAIKKGSEPERINYVDISSVSPGKIDKIEPMLFVEAPGRARRIVKHGDIIWSTVRPNRRSYALILNPPPDMVVSTGFAVVTPTGVPFSYLYHALTTDEFTGYLINHATGSAYPAVNAGDFESALIVVPPVGPLENFDNVVSDILAQQQVLHEKNANLRRTRDLLLPRLVSGEVRT